MREKKRRGYVECQGIVVLLRCDFFKGRHRSHCRVVDKDVESTARFCDLLDHRVNTLIGREISRCQALDGLSQVLLGERQLFCIAAYDTSLAPSRAKASPMAKPIPSEPPVMSASFP